MLHDTELARPARAGTDVAPLRIELEELYVEVANDLAVEAQELLDDYEGS